MIEQRDVTVRELCVEESDECHVALIIGGEACSHVQSPVCGPKRRWHSVSVNVSHWTGERAVLTRERCRRPQASAGVLVHLEKRIDRKAAVVDRTSKTRT